MIYATRGLVEVLLELAADHEPESLAVPLAVTPAAEFDATIDIPADAVVFTHFYFPDAARSLNAVFGMDLGIPVRRTQGRFVSHPHGRLELSRGDHFHELIFVAIPPWDTDCLAVFTRTGSRQQLRILDAEPAREAIPKAPPMPGVSPGDDGEQ